MGMKAAGSQGGGKMERMDEEVSTGPCDSTVQSEVYSHSRAPENVNQV